MPGTLSWSYTITTPWGETGSFTVTTSDTADVNGNYLATGISGTWNGAAIVALEPSDGSGYSGADNLLSGTSAGFNDGLDTSGLSFTTTQASATLWVNVFAQGTGSLYVVESTDNGATTSQTGQSTSTVLSTNCYLHGTRILTPNGEVPIEDLRQGDLVITCFGRQRPVRWIGQQSFLGRFLGGARAPVRIRAGALGDNAPHRDLYVSPDHSMLVEDRLVHAGLLVNGITITQTAIEGRVDYLHIDLGAHDCVLAEGAWAESYAEMGNRQAFHNAADGARAPAWQVMCRPQVRGTDPELAMLRRAVAAHIPGNALSDDADLHLRADGVRINPSQQTDGGWSFDIPAGVDRLRLVSRAGIPAALGLGMDRRLLGFCVTAIVARFANTRLSLMPSHPELGVGFHAAEDDRRRWTDGDAELPAVLRGDGTAAVQLVVSGYGLPRYGLQLAA